MVMEKLIKKYKERLDEVILERENPLSTPYAKSKCDGEVKILNSAIGELIEFKIKFRSIMEQRELSSISSLTSAYGSDISYFSGQKNGIHQMIELFDNIDNED